MKLLVTGGCGFLGSHVCEYFKKLGWDVVAYDSMTKLELWRTGYDTEAARGHNYALLAGMGVGVVVGDVRNLKDLLQAAHGCDYIVHTAAQPAMTIAIEQPVVDMETNVGGTLNVLEVARLLRIPMVNCSSIHVYGNAGNDDLEEDSTRFHRYPKGISEDEPILIGDITPLHASKRAAEIYTDAYIHTYGLVAANFRLTGMYGPRQFGGMDHGWVANFAIRTITGMPITIYGTDKQVRDILYAPDAARAFECFYENQIPGTYNIGGGDDTTMSIRECLDELEHITGRNGRETHRYPARKGDLWYFCCDINKAREMLRWEPEVMPAEGLRTLVEWIKTNKEIFAEKVAV